MSEYLNEIIGYEVASTAEWRRGKAEQFPEDDRNLRAAEELESLAAQIDALNGSEIEAQIREAVDGIANLGDWSIEMTEDVSAELRSIGFHGSYATATEFLEWYRDLVSEKLHDLIEDAVPVPSLHAQIEDDPTVQAAKRAYDEAYAKALAKVRNTI